MKKITYILILMGLLLPEAVFAYAFNKNYIISDYDLVDNNAMSKARIQEFLVQKGGALGGYYVVADNIRKSASQVIYEMAQSYRLNPKFILATLQKEQSLITDSTPSADQLEWAMGYGVCDSCSKSDPSLQKYRGFYNQLNYSSQRLRGDYYLGGLEKWGHTISGWGPGITKIVDGETVTPVNNATAVLYTYTPHLHGNYNFWLIWSNWFLKKYPNGSLLRVRGEPGIWLIRNNKRYNFITKSAFLFSYDINKVVDVSLNDIQAYDYGGPIKFAEYSLLQVPSGGVYILINGEKRAITSKEVFQSLGYSPEELIPAAWSDLEAYPDGEKITLTTAYPTGILLQSKQTGGIYYIINGQRRTIYDKSILYSQFPRLRWTQVDQSEIDQYTPGEPVLFRDGELVTSPASQAVYLIADGKKRPFPSYEVFVQMGYKWENIVWTTDRALEIHPLGEKIDYLS